MALHFLHYCLFKTRKRCRFAIFDAIIANELLIKSEMRTPDMMLLTPHTKTLFNAPSRESDQQCLPWERILPISLCLGPGFWGALPNWKSGPPIPKNLDKNLQGIFCTISSWAALSFVWAPIFFFQRPAIGNGAFRSFAKRQNLRKHKQSIAVI